MLSLFSRRQSTNTPKKDSLLTEHNTDETAALENAKQAIAETAKFRKDLINYYEIMQETNACMRQLATDKEDYSMQIMRENIILGDLKALAGLLDSLSILQTKNNDDKGQPIFTSFYQQYQASYNKAEKLWPKVSDMEKKLFLQHDLQGTVKWENHSITTTPQAFCYEFQRQLNQQIAEMSKQGQLHKRNIKFGERVMRRCSRLWDALNKMDPKPGQSFSVNEASKAEQKEEQSRSSNGMSKR